MLCRTLLGLSAVPLLLAAAGSYAFLQDHGGKEHGGKDHGGKEHAAAGHGQDPSPDEMMAMMPKPGPEHALLASLSGHWDAKTTVRFPGAPEMVTKGTETVSMLGGFWQISDFEGEMMGQKFSGRGTLGYDPNKKKYVGTWCDTMSPALTYFEGTMDAAKKTLTTHSSMADFMDPTKTVKMRMVTEIKSENARVFRMFEDRGDGHEVEGMTIEYTRREGGRAK